MVSQQSSSSMICRFMVSSWFNLRPSTCLRPALPKLVCMSVLFFDRLRLYWKNFVNGLFLFQWMVLNYYCFLFPIRADTSNFSYLLWQVVL